MEWLTSNGDVVQIVAIAIICGFLGFAIKQGSAENPKVVRWIPLIVGIVGGALGLVYKFISPDYAQMDVLMAIASGVVSGLASTGAHQIVKQGTSIPAASAAKDEPKGE